MTLHCQCPDIVRAARARVCWRRRRRRWHLGGRGGRHHGCVTRVGTVCSWRRSACSAASVRPDCSCARGARARVLAATAATVASGGSVVARLAGLVRPRAVRVLQLSDSDIFTCTHFASKVGVAIVCSPDKIPPPVARITAGPALVLTAHVRVGPRP